MNSAGTVLFTKPLALTVPGHSHDFDWYNSCETEMCPLAVNGSFLGMTGD